MSIDRIDSTKGYTRENVRLLCYAVNAMKGVWGDDHVVQIARGIVAKFDDTCDQLRKFSGGGILSFAA